MYGHILVATDGSDLADRALDHAISIATALKSDLTIVTVSEPVSTGYYGDAGYIADPNELIEGQEKVAKGLLDKAGAKVKDAGLLVKTVHVKDSFPAEGIVITAENLGTDLIVMGSHGRRGLGRLLLGSQTNNVLAQTKTPVLVTR
ncbi:universal stress protein [Bradyrhizobium sp. LHD-71]|uniref:universal stress protein n=1 Tax=Bradyrhizobium sp. LHD-71 TaxID=3072141 RepID=UPI00280CBD5B|nr:universal stress protein [Bradyrhizobium sp. LHD-71]MDQ8727569.1 universal stress protein [Bradyrhizobium sp. LHD-71]